MQDVVPAEKVRAYLEKHFPKGDYGLHALRGPKPSDEIVGHLSYFVEQTKSGSVVVMTLSCVDANKGFRIHHEEDFDEAMESYAHKMAEDGGVPGISSRVSGITYVPSTKMIKLVSNVDITSELNLDPLASYCRAVLLDAGRQFNALQRTMEKRERIHVEKLLEKVSQD